jgi:hypothetical protein
MHSQNMAPGNGVTLALCSPRRLLSRFGSMLRRSSAPFPVEACFSMRPFTLRQRLRTFRSTAATGLTLPACIFKAIPKLFQARSASRSRPRRTFCPPCEVRSTHAARCLVPFRKLAACLPASAPLQDLSILRDQSALPSSRRFGLPLRVARSSFAPQRAENNFLLNFALDHRSGSATSRQARCSFEPLGTKAMMPLIQFWVKKK